MSETAKMRIIEAAGPIFAQKGFAATTVREICSQAKVNQAAINYYFGSKESLYKEVFTATYSSFTPWNQNAKEQELDPSRPFVDRLREIMIRRTKEMFATELSRWKVQLMFREIHDPTSSCGEKLQEFIARDYHALYRFLDEWFTPETPEEIRWKFVFNMVGITLHYKTSRWLILKIINDEMREKHFLPEQIASMAVDYFLLAAIPYRRKDER